MPGILEAVNFSHLVTRFEVYQRLVDLDERIVLRWLMPGKPGADELGPPGSTKYRVWVRPKNSSNTRVLGGGHLVRLVSVFFFGKANPIKKKKNRYLKKHHKSWVCVFLFYIYSFTYSFYLFYS